MRIDRHFCHELMRFLEREDVFLTQIMTCLTEIAAQPAGTPFERPLEEVIAGLQAAAGQQNLDRAMFRTALSARVQHGVRSPRLSELDAGPELNGKLQRQRHDVLQKAQLVSARLGILQGQLRESSMVVTAILESVLGIPVERQRYDAGGKPVRQFSQPERRRSA